MKHYNTIVAEAGDLKCKMRAVHSDLITHAFTGEDDGPGAPEEAFNGQGFDLVSMCVSSYPFGKRAFAGANEGFFPAS